jgi:integrase
MKNVQRLPNGQYRYRRAVPTELRAAVGKREILRPLGTCDATVALLKATQLERQVERLFTNARTKLDVAQSPYEASQAAKAVVSSLHLGPNPGRHDRDVAIDVLLSRAGFLSIDEWARHAPRDGGFNVLSSAIGILQGDPAAPPMTIKDALRLYLDENQDKGRRSDFDRNKFERERRRIVDDVVTQLGGDRPVIEVTKADARKHRDHLVAQGYKPSSANKQLRFLVTIFKLALHEQDLSNANVWQGVKVADHEPDKDKRQPFTMDEAKLVLHHLSSVNTELRRIGLITAFSGARLAEICGLDANDVSLSEFSSINIRPNSHRTLKTKSSFRIVPIIGPALGALRAAYEDQGSGPIFPRYARPGGPDAASASLMKMLRAKAKIEDDKLTWHSWRHTIKDLMRNSGINAELQDRILGHSGKGASFNYGKGPDIGILQDLMATALAPLMQIVSDRMGRTR